MNKRQNEGHLDAYYSAVRDFIGRARATLASIIIACTVFLYFSLSSDPAYSNYHLKTLPKDINEEQSELNRYLDTLSQSLSSLGNFKMESEDNYDDISFLIQRYNDLLRDLLNLISQYQPLCDNVSEVKSPAAYQQIIEQCDYRLNSIKNTMEITTLGAENISKTYPTLPIDSGWPNTGVKNELAMFVTTTKTIQQLIEATLEQNIQLHPLVKKLANVDLSIEGKVGSIEVKTQHNNKIELSGVEIENELAVILANLAMIFLSYHLLAISIEMKKAITIGCTVSATFIGFQCNPVSKCLTILWVFLPAFAYVTPFLWLTLPELLNGMYVSDITVSTFAILMTNFVVVAYLTQRNFSKINGNLRNFRKTNGDKNKIRVRVYSSPTH